MRNLSENLAKSALLKLITHLFYYLDLPSVCKICTLAATKFALMFPRGSHVLKVFSQGQLILLLDEYCVLHSLALLTNFGMINVTQGLLVIDDKHFVDSAGMKSHR